MQNTANLRRVKTPLSLALVSLVAALALWVAVTDAENPTREGVFRGAVEVVPINVPEGQAVAGLSSPTVSLRIRAEEDTFGELTVDDFRAVVDLAGARDAVPELYVIATVPHRDDVRVVEATPSTVTVNLEPSVSRQLPVQPRLVGSPAQGFSVPSDGIDVSPSTVRVTGASSRVQLAATATADINLTGLRASLQQKYSLVVRDSRGVDLSFLTMEPDNADIRVNVVQQEVTLGLTVIAQLQGSIAEGYNLQGMSVDPQAVAVSGPLELLQAVSFVTTEAVDVSGLRADATRNIKLRLPTGLHSTRDTVTVRLRVAPAQGEWTIAVVPQVTNLGEGMRASLQTSSINLLLSGDLPTLRSLQPASLRTTVSVSGLPEGVHVLPPAVSVPEGVRLISTDPPQVVVVLGR